jgi:hypothetical protein
VAAIVIESIFQLRGCAVVFDAPTGYPKFSEDFRCTVLRMSGRLSRAVAEFTAWNAEDRVGPAIALPKAACAVPLALENKQDFISLYRQRGGMFVDRLSGKLREMTHRPTTFFTHRPMLNGKAPWQTAKLMHEAMRRTGAKQRVVTNHGFVFRSWLGV